jgi:hypothetical protein
MPFKPKTISFCLKWHSFDHYYFFIIKKMYKKKKKARERRRRRRRRKLGVALTTTRQKMGWFGQLHFWLRDHSTAGWSNHPHGQWWFDQKAKKKKKRFWTFGGG